ncbi:MAG: M20 family metallopeptidase, partial [Lysinibacillus sp.]
GNREAWTYDPFGAEIIEGRMYGRGTNDTKGNLACMITACQSILLDQENFTGKIILCIPCDEEGMMLGIKHFIKQGWADGVDGAIICEPEENQVCIAQRGAIRLRVDIYGKMAHGAISWSGINPNWRMARFITEMEKLEKEEQHRLGEDPFLKWPTITPTILRAPVKGDAQINVIPDHCMTTLDIRTVPAQDHDELLAKIEAIIERMKTEDPDFNVELTVLDNRPATATDKDEPVVQAIYQAVKEVLEKEPRYNGVPGATDGTFLHVHGVPIVTIGAGDREIPHQIDEYVDIEELAETTAIYRKAALLFLAGEEG